MDIEGMRAVAVVAVMLWHAGIPGVSGGFVGVDVFFVISGFLMTTLLIGDAQRGGRIQVLGFYARRVRRLLPAAATALAGTALITVLVLPPIRWQDIEGDITAAALYFVNWRFANRSADYLQQGSASSPLLHFWSLSVEEQFYLVLPVLLALVCLAVTTAARRRIAAGLVLAAGGLASFAFCVGYTASEPARAYFVTTTRAWELALGGMVAVTAPMLRRLPTGAAALLGWLGLAAVLESVIAFDAAMVFPGVAAALPTLGTAAVIAGGMAGPGYGPSLALRFRPLQVIGALSYSLYLWHWPLLVGARVLFGDRNGDLATGVALLVLAASAVPAWLSFRFVEERWRRPRTSSPRRAAAALLIACTAVSLVSAVGIRATLTDTDAATRGAPPEASVLLPTAVIPATSGTATSAVGSESGAARPGADAGSSTDGASTSASPAASASASPSSTGGSRIALGAQILAADPDGDQNGAPVDRVPFMTPTALHARDDLPAVYADGCHLDFDPVIPKECTFGDPHSATTVVVVGDSHAAQWVPALGVIAAQRHWKLLSYTKSSCPLTPTLLAGATGQPYVACQTWVANMLSELAKIKPAMIVTSSYSGYQALGPDDKPLPATASEAAMADGFRSVWTTLTRDGAEVEVIADNWAPGFDVPDCVSQHPTALTTCAFGRPTAKRADPQLLALSTPLPGVAMVNLDTAVCPTTRCAPVIGGVLVYRDDSHITKTYVLTLTPRLAAALPAA
jgi:peptidoglycan/LPS O-acetylase OafA/YrhL